MEGLSRAVWREAHPFHFRIRIESFSTLSKSSFQKYESCSFEAANHRWVLVLYPNGNKSNAVRDHILVYLKCVSTISKTIVVSFTLLVFDHVQNKYMSVANLSHVNSYGSELGFDNFLPLKVFKDPLNGYLVDDSCIFGADILVNETSIPPNGQCLSMMTTKPPRFKHTWKVENFSGLKQYQMYYSSKFTTRGHDWKIGLYLESGKYSMFLILDDPQTLLPKSAQVLAEYVLRVVDQNSNKNHKELSCTHCFLTSGSDDSSKLILPEVKSTADGYFVNNTCILEAEVTALGSAKEWA